MIGPAALGVQDAVLVTVKAPALASVASGIAPLLGLDTAVVFVMNGIPWWYFHAHGGKWDGRRVAQVDPGDAMWRAVGPGRAVGSVIYSACTVVEPDVVSVANRRNRIILGEPDGRLSARVAAIAAPLRAGGLAVDETPRIRDVRWEKLLGILQDLELGRPMEIDGIYDAALALARLAGVATPELDRLVALVNVRARQAGLYPGAAARAQFTSAMVGHPA